LSAGVQVPPTVAPEPAVAGDVVVSVPLVTSEIVPLSASVYALALAAVAVHFALAGRYGYFRDELYYAACGEHLAWGYIDHAPLAPFLARMSRTLFGDSLYSLRLLPTLAAGAKVFLAGWIARDLGGRAFGQFLAALTVFLAPIYLTFDSFFSMNAFEPVFWMAAAAIVIRILQGASGRLWLWFGLVAGIGLLNKHSMLFFGSGVAFGLLVTPARRQFASAWAWIGAALAIALFMPNIIWEFRTGWPTFALFQAVMGTKYTIVPAWQYIAQQGLLTHPVATPIWLAGLWFLWRDPAGKKYAGLAWGYVVVLVELLLLHGKIYYLAPYYGILLAAGAVWVEMRAVPRLGTWLRPAIVTPLVLGGLVAAPLAMPILPVEAAIRYTRFWDVQSVHVENVPQSELPQVFADMFGWQEQAAAVARVYNALPPRDRAQAAIAGYNFGEAGAIDYFGARLGLPHAISGHNEYGAWGPRGATGQVMVAIGFTREQLARFFDDIQPAATISPRYALPEESGLTIFVCRRPKGSLQAMWPGWRWLG
jgi:Dolichyl-phosphate-mannose-protein mannosyltransferase